MGDRPALKAVGYWREAGSRRWPRPQWLVRPGWHVEDRARIVTYLRSGHERASWLGCSFCRFGCGVDERLLGCRDLTDGEWVWPEGLAHYVEAHSVFLPEPLVDTIRAHGWRVPEQVTVPPDDAEPDFSVWEEWVCRHRRRPWYGFW